MSPILAQKDSPLLQKKSIEEKFDSNSQSKEKVRKNKFSSCEELGMIIDSHESSFHLAEELGDDLGDLAQRSKH